VVVSSYAGVELLPIRKKQQLGIGFQTAAATLPFSTTRKHFRI